MQVRKAVLLKVEPRNQSQEWYLHEALHLTVLLNALIVPDRQT